MILVIIIIIIIVLFQLTFFFSPLLLPFTKTREETNTPEKKEETEMKKFILIFGIATFAVHAIVSENDDEARIEQSQMEGNEN